MTWDPKRIWSLREDTHCVEISCHEVDADRDLGPYRWAMYCYIYPHHPLFPRVCTIQDPWYTDDVLRAVLCTIPGHSYCSFYEACQRSGRTTSIKIGWDFNHLHEDYNTRCTEPTNFLSLGSVLNTFLKDYHAPLQNQ